MPVVPVLLLNVCAQTSALPCTILPERIEDGVPPKESVVPPCIPARDTDKTPPCCLPQVYEIVQSSILLLGKLVADCPANRKFLTREVIALPLEGMPLC